MRFTTAALFLGLAGSALAQGAAPGKVDQKEIDAAIDRGATWLAKAGFGGGAGNNGTYELVMLTLLHSGTFPRDDKRFLAGVKALQTSKLTKTYATALTAMFLESYDRVANRARLVECAQFLIDNQCENGQWSYGEPLPEDPNKPKDPPPVVVSGGGSGSSAQPGGGNNGGGAKAGGGGGTTALQKIPLKRTRKGPPTGDHSNTQYAILGLRSCAVADIIMPKETWKDALAILEDAQDDKGGWSYSWMFPLPNGADAKKGGPKTIRTHNGAYGSMTAGITSSLVIVKFYLRTQWNEKEDFRKDKSILDGAKWIGEHFNLEENPDYDKNKATASVPTGDKYTWHYYWLYALERAGMLAEMERFGQHEWYQEGARWLLAKQNADGSWQSPGAKGHGGPDPVTDTCFAILFLRRATAPVVPKTVSGR